MLVFFLYLVFCTLSLSLVSLIFFNFPEDNADASWFPFAILYASRYVFITEQIWPSVPFPQYSEYLHDYDWTLLSGAHLNEFS